MTFNEFCQTLRSTSKEEYKARFERYLGNIRGWINESPELASVAGFLLGLVVALALKFFLIIGVVFGLIAALLWFIAPDTSSEKK